MGRGGGRQARLLKSGMIWDDPFPHLFGLSLSPIDYRIASVVPLLNIGDQNVRIRVIMWSTDAVAVLSVSNDKDQSETRTQKWHWSHVSGPDSLATVISVIVASSVTLIIINFAFGHFLTYVLFSSTIQSGRFISGHVPDLPSYSVCTNCGVDLVEIPFLPDQAFAYKCLFLLMLF